MWATAPAEVASCSATRRETTSCALASESRTAPPTKTARRRAPPAEISRRPSTRPAKATTRPRSFCPAEPLLERNARTKRRRHPDSSCPPAQLLVHVFSPFPHLIKRFSKRAYCLAQPPPPLHPVLLVVVLRLPLLLVLAFLLLIVQSVSQSVTSDAVSCARRELFMFPCSFSSKVLTSCCLSRRYVQFLTIATTAAACGVLLLIRFDVRGLCSAAYRTALMI